MKIALTSVMADDGGVFDIVSLSRHRRCSIRHLARAAPGETLDLGLSDWMMVVLLVSFSLLRASFWSIRWLEGQEVEGCFIYRIDDGGSRRRGAAGSR